MVSVYSKVAIWLVAVVVATGTVRALGELASPEQLWDTAYGRSILAKVALLAAIIGIALSSRRIVTALERLRAPGRRAVGRIPPRAALELGLAIAVVAIASLLGGQVPGRL
jgi:copper transport protein